MDNQDKCLFLPLPPELRCIIYAHAFVLDDADVAFEPVEVKAPSRSLLLACWQIHKEAKGPHELASRAYWRSTTFHLDVAELKDRYKTYIAADFVPSRATEMRSECIKSKC